MTTTQKITTTTALITLLVLPILFCHASITVYYQPGQSPLGPSDPAAGYTGAAAYDPTVLQAPRPPNPPIRTHFSIQLLNGGPAGASIQHNGAFFGFSIEMSVVDQVRESFVCFR